MKGVIILKLQMIFLSLCPIRFFGTTVLAIGVLASVPAQAALYQATRSSIDAIIGERMNSAPALGYYTSPSQTSLIGGTGSSATSTRYDQDLIYRYTLPTLGVGETIESFTMLFQITAMRDHSGDDYELDLYLLDTTDPTGTGTGLYLRAASDPAHELLGSRFIDDGGTTGSVTLDPVVNVSYTIDSGSALALLQSFYGGDHVPDQTEASFRFNLDRNYGGAIDSNSLNRYFVNSSTATSGFEISTVPEPSAWMIGILASLLLARRRRA